MPRVEVGTPASFNVEYAAQVTEAILLSNVAVRARRPIEYDAAAMKITNLPEANQYLAKTYPPVTASETPRTFFKP